LQQVWIYSAGQVLKMIGMLMQGNTEIDKLRQRAQDLGIVMTEDMMNAMEEYNDRIR
jgi:hypothetical protein